MIIEKVVSSLHDVHIRKDVINSPIWKDCYKLDEITEEMMDATEWWLYTVKFDGLKPVQVNQIQRL